MIHDQPEKIINRTYLQNQFDQPDITFQNRLKQGAIVLVDKPKTWTSFDVVNKIKKTFGIKKVGHAGTLDPMATGLLIVCTAEKTKIIDSFVQLEKTYTGKFKIGESTASFDAETEVIERKPFDHVSEVRIREAITQLTGEIEQIPPMYSALKKNGRPLYKLARKGIDVKREPRRVTVYEFEVTNFESPFISFRIRCSKGTYIRSIAHDFGEKLKTGAHLTELRRTAIGSLSVDDAVSIDEMNDVKDRLKRIHE